MDALQATPKEETLRVYYALKRFANTYSEIYRTHLQRVYKENKFLHGEVPVNLDKNIEMKIRIVLLQVEGILNVTNLPRHFALQLLRNLIDLSIAEIDAKETPSIPELDEKVLWNEFLAILNSRSNLPAEG